MPCSFHLFHPGLALTALLVLPSGLRAGDWREDLLRANKVELNPASLRQAASSGALDDERLKKAFAELGADDYQTREEAQRQLSAAGPSILEYLDTLGPIADPEVRMRAEMIRRRLSSGLENQEHLMLKYAARSLLQLPGDSATGGQFYEWFGEDSADCGKGYRLMKYQGPAAPGGGNPVVADGRLRIPGKLDGEQDQRLTLWAKDWPGARQLPLPIRVSCLMGGTNGNAGTWHPGIAVGKVKVLFHPDYRGGSLRFEQLDTRLVLLTNSNMGYTPKSNQMHRLELFVSSLPGDRLQFRAVVTSSPDQRFECSVQVDRADAGPLDSISLERSGRQGGDAVFDDLRVVMGK